MKGKYFLTAVILLFAAYTSNGQGKFTETVTIGYVSQSMVQQQTYTIPSGYTYNGQNPVYNYSNYNNIGMDSSNVPLTVTKQSNGNDTTITVSQKTVYRTIYTFNLNQIKYTSTNNLSITSVKLYYGTTGSGYTFKFTQPASDPASLSEEWLTVGNSSSKQTGIPYSGYLVDPASGLSSAISSSLPAGTMYLGAMSESESTNGSTAGLTISYLEVTYQRDNEARTVTAQNDMHGYTGGQIYWDGGLVTSPQSQILYEGVTDTFGVNTPQNYGSYQYIWNTGAINTSIWKKKINGGPTTSQGSDTSVSYTTTWNEVGTITYTAYMKRMVNVTFTGGGGTVSIDSGAQQSFPQTRTVIEKNPISAVASGYTANGITYTFNNSWTTSGGQVISSTTLYPTQHETYSANYTASISGNVTLNGNIDVPSGQTFTIPSGATVNLNGFYIKSTGGTIINNGSVTGLAATVTSGGSIKGFFPTVQPAVSYASSGYSVQIQPGTFTENLTVPSGVTVNGAGATSTIVNGTVTFSNVGFSSLAFLTVTNRINTIFSNNITLDNITAGSNSYFDIANSTAINITNITSSMPETWAIYSHSGSDFLVMGGTLNNKTDAIHLQDNSYADIFQVYFCTNSSYDIVSFSSTANAYGCTFTSSTPGGSVYGNVYWSSWNSCGGGGGGGFLGAAKGTDEVSTITTDDPAANEYALLMKSYRAVNDKVREDKNTDKHSVVKNYDKEYRDLINKYKQFIKKYPGSKYAVSLLYRISGVLLTLNDPGELSSYMQSIAEDSKLQNLKPYALTALVSKQIKTGNFRNAIDSYERLVKRYPSNSLTVEWLYAEGSVYKHLLKDRQKAYEIFARIIKDYPDSPTARSAKNEIGSEKTGSLLAMKKQANETPKGFSADNYPNPFNPSTVIRFNIPVAGRVTLKIYDVLGREVRALIDQEMTAGRHDIKWEGNNNAGSGVASGIYIYRLKYNNEVLNKKMLLLR